MITLPYNVGLKIRDEIDRFRRENNIPEPAEVSKLGRHRIDTFFESEMELVSRLVINSETINYIEFFPNIKEIVIDENKKISTFDLNKILTKYLNLEKLTIKDQDKIKFLDVSKLEKLQELHLISTGLNGVRGLEQLTNLKQLTFYNNICCNMEKDICEAALNLSKKGTMCNMDVLYMPTMIKIGTIPQSMTWCEAAGIKGEKLQYTTLELQEAVDIAQYIVRNYIKDTDTDLQKYAILYQWACEHIKYDEDSLNDGYTHSINGKQKGIKYGRNGTVNGLVYKNCVCEGYTKSMQLLLKICGIQSFDVGCYAENFEEKQEKWDFGIEDKTKTYTGDHSVLEVNIDGRFYYSDLTWDAALFQQNKKRLYFLLSRPDMLIDHQLNDSSEIVTARSISSPEFEKLMKFAQERINLVKSQLKDKKKSDKMTKEQEKIVKVFIDQFEQFLQRGADIKLASKDCMFLLENIHNRGKIDFDTYSIVKRAFIDKSLEIERRENLKAIKRREYELMDAEIEKNQRLLDAQRIDGENREFQDSPGRRRY